MEYYKDYYRRYKFLSRLVYKSGAMTIKEFLDIFHGWFELVGAEIFCETRECDGTPCNCCKIILWVDFNDDEQYTLLEIPGKGIVVSPIVTCKPDGCTYADINVTEYINHGTNHNDSKGNKLV